jgi:hypothetical protein
MFFFQHLKLLYFYVREGFRRVVFNCEIEHVENLNELWALFVDIVAVIMKLSYGEQVLPSSPSYRNIFKVTQRKRLNFS